jgi:hypothetical protein
MKHISLGGLDVSRIGLGTMAMSGYYLDPSSSEAESIRTTSTRAAARPSRSVLSTDSIELPEGKVIYPPKLHGEPIDRVACALLDMQQPSRSRFLRLVGPPGTGTSQSDRLPAVESARSGGRDAPRRAVLRLRRDVGRTVLGRVHAPLPEPAARSLTMPAAARSGRRASRGSRA